MLVNIYKFIYRNILLIFGLLISAFLLAIATTSTCYMIAHYSEINFFVSDSLFKNIIFILCILIVIFISKKLGIIEKINNYISNNRKAFYIIKYSLLALIFVMCVCWVLLARLEPNADARAIQQVVVEVRNGNLVDFMSFGYLSRYTNQLGMFLISYALSFIFGVNNFVAFGILNSIGIVVIYYVLADLSKSFGFNNFKQLLVILLGVLFLPLILYSTFIYGNVLGLTFALLSFKYEIDFLKNPSIKKIVLSSLFMMVSILFKMNNLIFLIGAIVYAVSINKIKRNGLKYYAIIVGLILSFVFSSILPIKIAERVTNGNLHNPVQKTSYVAMGLEESPRGPGWYTGYNQDIYYQTNGNVEKILESDYKIISDRMQYFLEHKGYALKFFTQKVASTWNNPLFQSFWVNQAQSKTEKTNSIVNNLLSVDNTYKFAKIYKYFEIFIYFGVFLYLILSNKCHIIDTSFLLLVFIGNFIFLLFWETKSEYSFMSFVILFPLAISGYGQLYSSHLKNKKLIISILLLSILIIIFRYTWIHDFLSEDNYEYKEYLKWPDTIIEKYK